MPEVFAGLGFQVMKRGADHGSLVNVSGVFEFEAAFGMPEALDDEGGDRQTDADHHKGDGKMVGGLVSPNEEVLAQALEAVAETHGERRLGRGRGKPAGRGGIEVDPSGSILVPNAAPSVCMGAADDVFAAFGIALHDGITL